MQFPLNLEVQQQWPGYKMPKQHAFLSLNMIYCHDPVASYSFLLGLDMFLMEWFRRFFIDYKI